MSRIVHLHLPAGDQLLRSLQIDDVVYVTGKAYTMLYADHYTHIMDLLNAGKEIPMDLKNGAVFNTGTIYKKKNDGSYKLLALTGTSSSKFNVYTPEFMEKTGVRVLIGKSGMDSKTLETLRKLGGVYLAIGGGCCAVYTPAAKIIADYWPELTPSDNQRLGLELNEFGPLFVAMDANGHSIYEDCQNVCKSRIPAMYERLGLKE